MLGGLREAGGFKPCAEAVEGTGGGVDSGVGNAVLVVLGDGAVVALALQVDIYILAGTWGGA
jgi:hypothetical protein